MKKFLALAAVLLSLSLVFAETASDDVDAKIDTTMQVIVPEDAHTTNKTAKVKIEYTASLDEVRIFYTCMASSFSESDARETIHACLNDFQLEHQYYGYSYMRADRTSYAKDSRGIKQAIYACQVKFTR